MDADQNIQIEVAILAGYRKVRMSRGNPFWGDDEGQSTYNALCGSPEGEALSYFEEIPNYLESRDAIIPVIEKQKFTEEQWETFLRFCVPNESDWIACNKLGLGVVPITQSRLPRAYRMLVLLTARELCIALLKTFGKM